MGISLEYISLWVNTSTADMWHTRMEDKEIVKKKTKNKCFGLEFLIAYPKKHNVACMSLKPFWVGLKSVQVALLLPEGHWVTLTRLPCTQILGSLSFPQFPQFHSDPNRTPVYLTPCITGYLAKVHMWVFEQNHWKIYNVEGARTADVILFLSFVLGSFQSFQCRLTCWPVLTKLRL